MNVVRPLVMLALTVMPGLQAQQHQHPATVAPPATLDGRPGPPAPCDRDEER